ncbi:hypothetical protein CTI12_AA127570 [Artemisia annua]|uniref:Helitron helicase-like domain-containing protein n=1 Tax=Artemisia annua TaxID=35608 RepID=A0A2U1PPG6_ARTAN|nr:hypothetical protein CTI12_AA127570 [Artemisia annua]
MKIKKKAIRRVKSTASFESARNCSSGEHQESYSVDVGGETVSANVDDVGLRLDFVSGLSYVPRNVTSHVSAGNELQKHTEWNTSVQLTGKRALEEVHTRTTDSLGIHPPCYVHPAVLRNEEKNCVNEVSNKGQPSAGTENPSMTHDNCHTVMRETIPDESIRLYSSSNQNGCTIEETRARNTRKLPMDKGKRKICDASNKRQMFSEACELTSFAETEETMQLLSTVQPPLTRRRRRGRPRKRNATSVEGSTDTGTVMHENRRLCQPTSSSNESSRFQTTPTDDANLNSTAGYPQHQQQARLHPSSARTQRRGNTRNRGPPARQDIVENLIDILDDHNELVQLFRTARNKMAEADIPQFKVRLFGIVGSRQHELPTSDSIGAIVLEGGPDVQTDFDVVIEQHDGRLKQVNKLNASYMSLQFPLIFLFGEDGYHLGRVLLNTGSTDDPPKKMTMLRYYSQMEQSSSIVPSSDSKGKEVVTHSEEIALANLKESDTGKAIYVKVYRKWAPTNKQSKPHMHIDVWQ